MANHKSALKRIRSDETKKSLNKLQHKTTRNAIKKIKEAKSKKDAARFLGLSYVEYMKHIRDFKTNEYFKE